MTLSTRLTRAAVAFLIFGTVASVLPMNTSALAAPGYPGVSNGNGRGRRGAFEYFRVHPGKGSNPKSDPNAQFSNSNLDSFARSRSRSSSWVLYLGALFGLKSLR